MPLRERSFAERVVLVGVLPCVAGMVNAAGFLRLGLATSHVTGNVTWLAMDLSRGDLTTASHLGGLVGCFFTGAVVGSLLVDGGVAVGRSRYAAALLLEAALLAGHTLLASGVLGAGGGPSPFPHAALLGLAMGLQNALITRLSGAVVRTTHLTGVVTDLAIGTVRVGRFLLARTLGRVSGPLRAEPDFLRLRLHAGLFASFSTGAALIPPVVGGLGPLWTGVPILLLLGLVGVDLVLGIGRVNPRAA